MIFIGVDPGSNGAIATIDEYDTTVCAFTVKTFEADLVDTLLCVGHNPAFCCVEQVGSMPGQGTKSMFSFGQNYGFIQGALRSLKIPYELVKPRTWKKEFGCTSDKNTSIAVCQRLFPDVSLYRTNKCKKPHDGMAEALLLAEYARRKYGEGNELS